MTSSTPAPAISYDDIEHLREIVTRLRAALTGILGEHEMRLIADGVVRDIELVRTAPGIVEAHAVVTIGGAEQAVMAESANKLAALAALFNRVDERRRPRRSPSAFSLTSGV